MLAQQVAAEVAGEVAPYRVDVVAVVLRVVVLDEERRALDPIVVLLAALDRARPGEGDLLDARLAQLRDPIVEAGAAAVAAGSLFVYVGRKRGVLINYPEQDELAQLFAVTQ